MHTKLWYKIFYGLSLMLFVLFVVFHVLNKKHYDVTDATLVELAPFKDVVKRLCERFLIPGLLFLVAGVCSHNDTRKTKESENENSSN